LETFHVTHDTLFMAQPAHLENPTSAPLSLNRQAATESAMRLYMVKKENRRSNSRRLRSSFPLKRLICIQIHPPAEDHLVVALPLPNIIKVAAPTTRQLHPALAGMVRGRDLQSLVFAG
jgi:hypothetical protein